MEKLHGVLGRYKTEDGRHSETTGTTNNRQALLFARPQDYICIEITLQNLVNATKLRESRVERSFFLESKA